MDHLFDNGQDIRFTQKTSAIAAGRLVCLNFKVPLRVRQQFKIYAARHNMTMTEMLLRFLEDYLHSDVNVGAGQFPPPTRQEIKK